MRFLLMLVVLSAVSLPLLSDEAVPDCNTNQIIKWNGSAWVCAVVDSSCQIEDVPAEPAKPITATAYTSLWDTRWLSEGPDEDDLCYRRGCKGGRDFAGASNDLLLLFTNIENFTETSQCVWMSTMMRNFSGEDVLICNFNVWGVLDHKRCDVKATGSAVTTFNTKMEERGEEISISGLHLWKKGGDALITITCLP